MTSLILQQASRMAAQGGEETPLIFATQTAATVADLDIEGYDAENLSGAPMLGPSVMESATGANLDSITNPSIVSSMSLVMPSTYATSVTGRSEANMSMVASTRAAPSLVSVVPYFHSQVPIQPYNSSAMYEDTMLPMYVD